MAGEDKEATEDKDTMESDDDAVGQSTSESDASVAIDGDGDAASSSSDVAKMEDTDAEQVTLSVVDAFSCDTFLLILHFLSLFCPKLHS